MKLSLITTLAFALVMFLAIACYEGFEKALMIAFAALIFSAIIAIVCILLYAIAELPNLDEDKL